MKAIIIGSGNIAQVHIAALKRLGHEVSWMVGRDYERTGRFAQENDIPHFTTDLSEALGSDADFVHICTPPVSHADLIRASLAANKHVICEKPLCIDPCEAKALAAEAEEAYQQKGLITALCCNVRYYPANREVSELLRNDGGGEARIISGSYLQSFHIPPHEDSWRFDHDLSEGQRAISEIGTHWIDLSGFWTGLRITGVYAELENWYPVLFRKGRTLSAEPDGEEVHIDTEDTAAVILRFENGAVGTLLLSETAPGHFNDLSIEVTDLKTTYRWEELHPDKLWFSDAGSMKSKSLKVSDRTETFVNLFRDVYAAAESKMPGSYPTFADGAYISAVCHAISESGKTHRWTEVDL
ncbi:MAG: Gfo/Idh/MocA family oxidoreductase [Mogibacterium sp.]|nr:Gfo/Idh/MocA family oxidoreductase [Mogibacterium sp.]MBQ6388029.1 Gfo/Idh/MocA family oxidoreductase [Mogibacterium sp.]